MQKSLHAMNIFKTVLTVLVALFVALRVVAQPMMLTASEPGVMALCSGGQIVYVSLETGEPVETDDTPAPAADPCPFIGVTAFDLIAEPETHVPAPSFETLAATMAETTAPVLAVANENAARAPPARS